MRGGTVPLDTGSDIEPSDLDTAWSALMRVRADDVRILESHVITSRLFLGSMSDPTLLDGVGPEDIEGAIARIASSPVEFDVSFPDGAWYVHRRSFDGRLGRPRLTVIGSNRAKEVVRRTWAEHWSLESVMERDTMGIDPRTLPSLLIQRACTPVSSGRMVCGTTTVIESVLGTATYMDMGVGPPDRFSVHGGRVHTTRSAQGMRTILGDDGVSLEQVPPAEIARPSLDEGQALTLAALGARIDRRSGRPHEVHWEWHHDGPVVVSVIPLGPGTPPGVWRSIRMRGMDRSMSPLSTSILIKALREALGEDAVMEDQGGIFFRHSDEGAGWRRDILRRGGELRFVIGALLGRTKSIRAPIDAGSDPISSLEALEHRLASLLGALIPAIEVHCRLARTPGYDAPYAWDRDMDEQLEAVAAMLSEGDPDAGSAITSLLSRFGDRAPAYDIASPRWVEDPRAIMMEAWSRSMGGYEHGAHGQRHGLLSRIDWSLARLGDEAWGLSNEFRSIMLMIGGSMAARGVIPSTEDIFLMTMEEVVQAWDGHRRYSGARMSHRRRTCSHVGRRIPETIIDGNRSYGTPSTGTVSSGTPASPGTHTGRARVIRSFDDLLGTVSGDVLVMRTFRPEWSPILDIAGALITSRDGTLSIGSRMARERGVPCVIGAAESLMCIDDGLIVTVDGSRGEVRTHVMGGPTIPPQEFDERRLSFDREFLRAIDGASR